MISTAEALPMKSNKPVLQTTPRRKNSRAKIHLTARQFDMDWKKANLEFRKSYLLEALAMHEGNIVHTANALGIVRRTLQKQLRAVGICAKGNGGNGCCPDGECLSEE